MRFSALRVRFLLLTVVFAGILVGSASLVSYVVVANAMVDVAEATVRSASALASDTLSEAVTRARIDAAASGLEGRQAEQAALEEVLDRAPDVLVSVGAADVEFALYSPDLELLWSSGRSALNEHSDHRALAVQGTRRLDTGRANVRRLSGFFGAADLGDFHAHVPVDLPYAGTAVLDITYVAAREEATIDRIRPWMMLLAVTAVAIAVLLMHVTTGWILGLIAKVQEAADSIDADRLNTRLPDLGNHEVGDLARSLNQLIERLQRRADAQSRFVADASHELATPVAGIRGYVNILRDWGAEDPELRREAVDAIDRESARMARLCSDLLSLIRRERFSAAEATRFDLNALSREILADAATRYIGKGIDFEGPEEGPLNVSHDYDRLAQLLAILVDNAAKYTRAEGGRVRVRTWRRLDSVFLEVSDTGVGIPAKDVPHIFERFYRSDEARPSEPGGFGIGLSIAHDIVSEAGGRVEVRSAEGVGTTFTVKLPRRVGRVGSDQME